MLIDGELSRIDAVILLIAFVGYMGLLVHSVLVYIVYMAYTIMRAFHIWIF